jgi:Ca-activated chloride channel family protein
MSGTDLVVFAREEWFHLFWIVGLVLVSMLSYARWRKKVLSEFGGRDIVHTLLSSMHPTRRFLKGALFIVGLSFVVLAASGPMWGKKAVIVQSKGKDVFFIIDISASMTAEDVRPNRLARAKLELSRLIEKLEGNRLGLIIFAGESFVLCPLTLDTGACMLLLDCIDARNVPRPGTSLAAAIENAVAGFEGGEKNYRAVVLVTDGEDLEGDVEEAISMARENGLRIFALGVGTHEGAPIPLREDDGTLAGYKKDREGETVVTKLGEDLLTHIARETGGEYAYVGEGNQATERIVRGIQKMDEKVLAEEEMKIYKERFQVPLAAAFILLFLEACIGERRGK